MTANARKMISSRPGNGAPASVDSGIASAAASETAPRRPDHDDHTLTPGRRLLVPATSHAEERRREIREGHRQQEPDQHHRPAHREGADEQLVPRPRIEPVDTAGS